MEVVKIPYPDSEAVGILYDLDRVPLAYPFAELKLRRCALPLRFASAIPRYGTDVAPLRHWQYDSYASYFRAFSIAEIPESGIRSNPGRIHQADLDFLAAAKPLHIQGRLPSLNREANYYHNGENRKVHWLPRLSFMTFKTRRRCTRGHREPGPSALKCRGIVLSTLRRTAKGLWCCAVWHPPIFWLLLFYRV